MVRSDRAWDRLDRSDDRMDKCGDRSDRARDRFDGARDRSDGARDRSDRARDRSDRARDRSDGARDRSKNDNARRTVLARVSGLVLLLFRAAALLATPEKVHLIHPEASEIDTVTYKSRLWHGRKLDEIS